jgi:large subunit ribosomal protein L15
MKLNTILDNPGSSKSRMRVGRGIGSGKGKTCGRGVKGQKARTGVAIKGFEGGQMPLHRRLPKRGFWNPFSTDYNELNVGRIQAAVDAGKLDPAAVVTIEVLVAVGLCTKPRDGVKILGVGDLSAKLSFEVAAASKRAVAAIEAAGGSIRLLTVAADAEDPAPSAE